MAVLIKGKSISCSQKSHNHYLRGKENERITVREVRGFATKDSDEALEMVNLSAKGTKCKKPLYSVKLNPEPDRLWTKDEIRRAVELLEENLGLKDHPRVVIEHKKHGRVHYHILWSRFPPDGRAAVRMSNDYAIHQKTQRQIEKEFKLRPMLARGRDFKQWEVEWAKRYKFDIFKLREEITADFKSSKSGQKFMDSLKDKGVVLCRGDKSQFVLVLPWGQHKALSSMIHGRPIKAVLRRSFADIDIAKLPTVTEGKSQVRASLPKLGDKPRRSGRIYIRGGSTQTGSWQPYAVLRAAHQPKLSSTMETTGTTPVAPNKISANRKIEKQKPPLRPEEIEDDEKISLGRAEAAYKDEFDRWEGLIKAAASDLGLSKDQRLAGVAALRSRQRAAAKAAYKRVVNEEKAIAKAARRAKRVLLGFPEPPPSSR